MHLKKIPIGPAPWFPPDWEAIPGRDQPNRYRLTHSQCGCSSRNLYDLLSGNARMVVFYHDCDEG